MSIKRILLGGVLTVIIAFSASAQVSSKHVTFSKAVIVNGVNLKAGTYRVEFDSAKGELSFLKSRKIVAKASARAEATPTKASFTRIVTTQTDSGELLVSIAFSGKDQQIVLANAEGSPSLK